MCYTFYLGGFENLTMCREIGFQLSTRFRSCALFQYDRMWKLGIGLFKTKKQARDFGKMLEKNGYSGKVVQIQL